MSRRQAQRLSDRLRTDDPPTDEDVVLLAELLIEHNAALGEVSALLAAAGFSATTRLKTSGTIIDKLRRMPDHHLRNIRDLAGARIVRPMTLDEQDDIAGQIRDLWPQGTARIIDRRVDPSHGYRAVHIVPRIDHCSVEIQLRTLYQDTWAQVMERFGDMWGRQIRYGGVPDDPDALLSNGPLTRQQFVDAWKVIGDDLYALAQVENRIARLRSGVAPTETETIEELQAQVDERFGSAKELELQMREAFGGLQEG